MLLWLTLGYWIIRVSILIVENRKLFILEGWRRDQRLIQGNLIEARLDLMLIMRIKEVKWASRMLQDLTSNLIPEIKDPPSELDRKNQFSAKKVLLEAEFLVNQDLKLDPRDLACFQRLLLESWERLLSFKPRSQNRKILMQ